MFNGIRKCTIYIIFIGRIKPEVNPKWRENTIYYNRGHKNTLEKYQEFMYTSIRSQNAPIAQQDRATVS